MWGITQSGGGFLTLGHGIYYVRRQSVYCSSHGTFEHCIGPEVCDALGLYLSTRIAYLDRLKKSENRLGGSDYITQDAWVNIRVVEL